jgi:hypothetical protein
LGQPVSSVVYELVEDGSVFRVLFLVDLPAGGIGREHELFKRLVAKVSPPRAFALRHRATIVDQDAEGRVGVRLDDEDAPLLTLAAVPVYFGLPGVTFTASAGAQVLVEFLGGDERRPAVTGFLTGCAFGQTRIASSGAAARGAARLGDTGSAGTLLLGSDFSQFPLLLLMAYIPPGVPIPPVVSVPPFVPTGVPILAPIPAPIPFPMSMQIGTASDEVLLR